MAQDCTAGQRRSQDDSPGSLAAAVMRSPASNANIDHANHYFTTAVTKATKYRHSVKAYNIALIYTQRALVSQFLFRSTYTLIQRKKSRHSVYVCLHVCTLKKKIKFLTTIISEK